MGSDDRILVVAPDTGTRQLMVSLLQDDGHVVDAVNHLHQLPPRLATEAYSLVIVDEAGLLDGTTGDVLASLKQQPDHRGPQIILVTDGEGTAPGTLEHPVDDLFLMPFKPAIFSRTVRRALDHHSLQVRLASRISIQDALIPVFQRVGMALNVRDVLNTVLLVSLEVLPRAHACLVYHDDETGLVSVGLSSTGEYQAPPGIDKQVQQAVQKRHTAYIPDWLDRSDGIGRALLIEPLVQSGLRLGALVLIGQRADVFDQEERQISRMLAAQATIALQNARLYEEGRRVDELEALHEASNAINRTLDLQETLTATMAVARSLTRASVCGIYLASPVNGRVESAVTLNDELPLCESDRHRSAEIARNVLNDVLRGDEEFGHPVSILEPVIVFEPSESDSPAKAVTVAGADDQTPHSIQTWLAVPLMAGGTLVGVLELGSQHANAFARDDVRLVRVVASHAAAAIQNARLFEESQQRLRQAEALSVISQSICNTLDLSRVLELVVSSAAKTIPAATHSTLYLLDACGEKFVPEARMGQVNLPVPGELEEKRLAVIHQARSRRAAVRENHDSWSLMAVPLVVQETVIGAICVESPFLGTFATDDERLLDLFASHASIAIHNANLFRDLSAAYSETARQQEETVRANRVLQALFDGITDGLYIVDRDLRVVAVNKEEAKRLDITVDALLHRACDEHVWGEVAPALREVVSATFEGGREGNWDSRNYTGNAGAFNERDVRTYPIFTPSGEVAQVIIFAQDVSERRWMEASLFRSANLAAVGQLASSIAHQINNPLTVVIANAQTLHMDMDPSSPDRATVEIVLDAGKRINSIVQNLLDFSSQDSYDWYATDVWSTIEDALDFTARPLHEAQIEVIKETDDLPDIVASASHLKLLWMNLLLNARDAILSRRQENRNLKGTIWVRAAYSEPEGVMVQIVDNGTGISTTQRDQIFQPFFTTRMGGTALGLGLHTSRRIVTSHQGKIEIENNLDGQGAVVTVVLPAQPDPDPDTQRKYVSGRVSQAAI